MECTGYGSKQSWSHQHTRGDAGENTHHIPTKLWRLGRVSWRDLCSPGILRSTEWFCTDVSGQPIGPRMSVQNNHSKLRNIPQECRSHLHRCESLKWRLSPEFISHVLLACCAYSPHPRKRICFSLQRYIHSLINFSGTLLSYDDNVFQFAVVHYFTKYGSGECYFILDLSSDSSSDDEEWNQGGGGRRADSVSQQCHTPTVSLTSYPKTVIT
jgi:hypothetical protein